MLKRNDYKIFRKGVKAIRSFGQETGPFMPWHFSKDGYHWLVAESLLRRTTRTAAEKAYSALIKEHPSWEILSQSSKDHIKEHVAWIGLGHQRSAQLKKLADIISNKYKGETPKRRDQLMELPGVGDYIADAIMLYINRRKFFPIDPNIQRVIRRLTGRPTSIGTRHSTPYLDQITQEFSSYVRKQLRVDDLINLHRGLLRLSWNCCKPKPICQKCILPSFCKYVLMI